MTEKEQDERKQVEEGLKEDLELDESEAGDVSGGGSFSYGKVQWTYTPQKADGSEPPKTLK